MKFPHTVFTMTTNAIPLKQRKTNTDGDQTTVVTLTTADVPDQIVVNALSSGQSPRVRYGGEWRKNGVPPTVTMSWVDWLGAPKSTMSRDQIRATAENDAEFMAEIKAKVMAEMREEEQRRIDAAKGHKAK